MEKKTSARRKEKVEIIHRLSTLPGQSGAPLICIDQDNKLSIVGIHVGAVRTKKEGVKVEANVGRLLTP